MKIKEWKELDGKRNGDVLLYVNEIRIDVTYDGIMLVGIIYSQTPQYLIIKTLKVFGFDIEFIESPKLTEQEWHFVRAFDTGWIARDRNDKANIFFGKPFKQLYVWVHNGGYIFQVPSGMFHFITWESEPWSIADLRKLEKE